MLKPQDVVILLKLVAKSANAEPWNFATLAKELCMSSSEVHAGFKRAIKSQLINPQTRAPNLSALSEFIVHGLRYVFPAERGEITRGLPTAHAAAPLKTNLIEDRDLPPVWPHPHGTTRGQAFLPLYESVSRAVETDPQLYELLALVDAIRGGRARERNLAIKELKHRLGVA
ncbi:MAG TPA: hypothetical protein DCG57_19585 [Candidatus Riflebacteria bacterium]|jgi:hypothetical protein|nr:hypothetical protein [Candidatus Riflebacteria bacterium]